MAEKYEDESKGTKDFETVEAFIEFLEGTLIPDLKNSGKYFTARDFEEAIRWIRKYKEKSDAQNNIQT